MDEWYDYATMDDSKIRMYWQDTVTGAEREYNIGVDCTDMVVVDVDQKDGKNGLSDYAAIPGNSWDTLCVRTPSGGYHLYFGGPDCSNAPLSDAVDIRSHHGYVLAPGSHTEYVEGKSAEGYYEVVRDVEPAWVPYGIESRLTPLRTRSATDDYVSGEDTPAQISAVTGFLESAPPAIEGNRGDDTTFQTAARCVREFGLSVGKTFELMRDIWNPTCIPPWGLEELQQKVENAAEYGTATAGRVTFETMFGGLELPPPPTIFEQSPGFGVKGLTDHIRPRDWLSERFLLTSYLTLIIAVGSVGKSTFGLAVAAHGAVGVDFGPYKFRKTFKSVVYNGEDDVEEQERRLLAICIEFGLPYSEVRPRVMLLSEEEVNLRLVVPAGGGAAQVDTTIVDQLISILSDPEVGLFIGDPLIDMHSVNEGEPGQMNVVMKTLKHICKKANVAGIIMHHATKGGNEKQEQRIGNMDIARGSSAIINKCRIAFTLMNASATDADDYGMRVEDRKYYLRLDDAKMNLTLADEKPQWFKRSSIKLNHGDVVGVFRPVELTKSTMYLRLRIAETIIATLQELNTSTMAMQQLIGMVKEHEPLWANKSDIEIRQKLDAMFLTPFRCRDITLQIKRDETTKKPLLVMS